jgi:tripartite ATP-independent transporter DctP family solute receptor
LLICLSLVAAACGGSGGNTASEPSAGEASVGKTYNFKFTHNNQTTHIFHKTAVKFQEELEARSGGRMKVEIFPAAQLGPEKDTVAQIQTGALEMGIITNAYLASNAEAFNAWFMPFVFNSVEEAAAARNSEPAKKILETLGDQGMVGLDFIFAGNRHILMKSTSVSTPDDLKGKKIRITGSPSITDFWTSVGAGPTPMPLPEVFQALQTGVIDGIDIDLDALMTEKLYEVAKHFTVTNHMAFPGVFLMNKTLFDSMSAEDQQIVREAAQAAVEWGNQESAALETSNLEALKAQGVTVTELANREAFTAVKDDIYSKYSSNPIIKEFLDTFAKE